jgi:hypothetical protein
MRQRWFKRWICSVVIVVLVGVTAGAVSAETPSVLRSALVPGTGQAHEGHYGKAAVFAGAAVITGVGLFLSQVHYNQAAMRYNDLRGLYLSYPEQLRSGEVTPYGEIEETYRDMNEAWDKSEDRKVWRNTFLVAFLATYALNLVDVIMSERETGERPDEAAGAVSFEMRGDHVMVFKSFNF